MKLKGQSTGRGGSTRGGLQQSAVTFSFNCNRLVGGGHEAELPGGQRNWFAIGSNGQVSPAARDDLHLPRCHRQRRARNHHSFPHGEKWIRHEETGSDAVVGCERSGHQAWRHICEINARQRLRDV